MRIKNLKIENFRKIKTLNIDFPDGLCVIVGENNVGKTAIVDALRFMLLSSREFDSLRITEDDFRDRTDYLPIEISCTFSDLDDEAEASFLECLVDTGEGNFEVQIHARIAFNEDTRRAKVEMWGGETEGGSIPSDFYDQLAAIYLQPLRDPAKGLRPSQNSQISRLIDCFTDEQQRSEFENIVKDANEAIQGIESVIEAKNDLNQQMTNLAGSELTQDTELIFNEPNFRRIIAGLQPQINGLPFSLNGLGYNNLIFTAASLGTLSHNDNFLFRSILVEEPEAHLHPQLQVLLLQYFENVSSLENNNVQVIVSSHSPTLVSQAPLDSIVSIHETSDELTAVSIFSLNIEKNIKKKLQRFLDTTRAELFFARRLLMVEGIAEALLLPVLTKIAGGCLKKSSVTLLNAHGINFNAFLPLFGERAFQFPVAILTDGDAKSVGGEISSTTVNLKNQEENIQNLRIQYSEITFEHELARSHKILMHMLNALEILRPRVASKLKNEIENLDGNDSKATKFLDQFLTSKVSKGEFAQELAIILTDADDLQREDIPQYILEALEFLSVCNLSAGH